MNSLTVNKDVRKKEYFGLMSRIGFSLLLFILLSYVLPSLAIVVEMIAMLIFPEQPQLLYAISSAAYFVSYIAMFVFPAILFFLISRNRPHERIGFSFSMPSGSFYLISASLVVTVVAAYVNSFIVGAVQTQPEAAPISTVPELVFNVLLIAVAPAIAEEILFRGVILKNLLPYGKGLAVIGSAVLFGLMHQNGVQFFYTTVAGIVFALIYIKTGSLFVGMVFHFINNLLSVVEEYILGAFGASAYYIFSAVELSLILSIGILSAVKLFSDHKKESDRLKDGIFEIELEEDIDHSSRQITSRTAALGFLTPPMLVFIAESFVMTILSVFITVF